MISMPTKVHLEVACSRSYPGATHQNSDRVAEIGVLAASGECTLQNVDLLAKIGDFHGIVDVRTAATIIGIVRRPSFRIASINDLFL
jgi:hypothetical protein